MSEGATGNEAREDRKRSRSRSALKTCLWGGVALLTLFILFYSIENLLGNGLWKEERANWEDGLPTVADLRPEPVPDDENFGALPILQRIYLPEDEIGKANLERLRTLNLRYALPEESDRHNELLKEMGRGTLTSFRPWAELFGLELAEGATEEDTMRAVLAEVERIGGEVLAELARGTDLPHSMITGDYYDYLESAEMLFNVSTPYLFNAMAVCKTLELRGVLAARLGEREVARESIAVMMQLARFTSSQWLVGALVGGALQRNQVAVIEEGLERDLWTEEDLVYLDQLLGRVDWAAVPDRVMKAELVGALQAMEAMKGNSQAMFRQMGVGGGTPWWTLGGRFVPSGWVDRNKAHVAKFHRELNEVEPGERRLWRMREIAREAEEEFVSKSRSPSRFLAAMVQPTFHNSYRRFLQLEAEHGQTRIALALGRFKLERGHLPDSLSQLAPKFLAEVPIDPVDGAPMRYAKLPGGKFKLWSLGVDLEDDGGTRPRTMAPAHRDEGDWVWGRPRETAQP